MNNNSAFFLSITFGLMIVWPQALPALSLGPIDIKSSFGEKFNAEIEVTSIQSGNVKIGLGTPEDYRRLEVKRPSIVDDLVLRSLSSLSGDGKVIKIISDHPLFYPSFNLVIRAEEPGGTVLENYLVAVDFHQKLTLGFKGEKKNSGPMEPVPPPPVVASPKVEPEIPTPVVVPEPAPQPVVVARAPAPYRQGHDRWSPRIALAPRTYERWTEPPRKAMKRVEEPVEAKVLHDAKDPERPVEQDKTEEPEGSSIAETLASALQKLVAPSTQPLPDEPEPVAAVAGTDDPQSVAANYGPVKEGDTLLKISKTLGYDASQAFQFAVAVWETNQDRFLNGNMHGIKEGVTLDMTGVRDRVEALGKKEAKAEIMAQWDAWNGRAPAASQREAWVQVAEAELPEESNPDLAGMFALIRGWQDSWEANDLDRHLALFKLEDDSGEAMNAHLKNYKRRMFKGHHAVKLDLKRPRIVKRGNDWVVSFDQVFQSDTLDSRGQKELRLVREGLTWKIANERFRVKSWSRRQPGDVTPVSHEPLTEWSSPHVIRVSTHFELSQATRVVNQLRFRGYSAYSSLLGVTDNREVYEVFVGRFTDWDDAERVSRALRRLRVGRQAIPLQYPYSLEIATYDSDAQAIERLRELRTLGISGFLFRAGDSFDSAEVKVMAGAFDDPKDSERLQKKLSQAGIEFELIAP